jgi:hypothetical protein
MTLPNKDENDDLGAQLARELHRRTDTLIGTPLGFDDVRGKATSIRRRRQVATGLGVAAAVAVIVPTAMFATRGGESTPQPATPLPSVTATPSPSQTPSPTSSPVMGPKPHALDVRDLPTGAPPAIAYRDEGTIQELVLLTDGTRVDRTDAGIVVTTGSGTFGPYLSDSPLARNDQGTIAAWVTTDSALMVWQVGQSQPLTIATSDLAGTQLAAVTGNDCTTGDCRLWIRGSTLPSGDQESQVIDGDVTVSQADHDGHIIAVRDADDSGRVLGSTEIGDGTSCSAVVDGTTTLLAMCDYQLDSFAPSGSYVLASEPYHSGASSGTIAVFAMNGDRTAYRVRTSQHMAGIWQAEWEDSTHVLFIAIQDGQWSIVRMGVDGSLEYAVPPVAGDPYLSPFALETR